MCLNQFMATLEYFLPLLEFTQVQKIHLESDVNAADYDINACAGRLSVRGTALFFVTNKGKQKNAAIAAFIFCERGVADNARRRLRYLFPLLREGDPACPGMQTARGSSSE